MKVSHFCEASVENLQEMEEHWETALEVMGAAASIDELRQHLALAPNPNSEMAEYLRDHLNKVVELWPDVPELMAVA